MNIMALHHVHYASQLMAAPQCGQPCSTDCTWCSSQPFSTGEMAAALPGAATWLRQRVLCSVSGIVPMQSDRRRGPGKHQEAAARADSSQPTCCRHARGQPFMVLPDTSTLAGPPRTLLSHRLRVQLHSILEEGIQLRSDRDAVGVDEPQPAASAAKAVTGLPAQGGSLSREAGWASCRKLLGAPGHLLQRVCQASNRCLMGAPAASSGALSWPWLIMLSLCAHVECRGRFVPKP